MELANLLPMIVGAAVLPAWIVVVLLLLRGGGVRTATAFVAGATTVRLVQGILLGLVFSAPFEANCDRGGGLIASTLILAVGILMVVTDVMASAFKEGEDCEFPIIY